MPRIDIDKVKASTRAYYPAPFDKLVAGRETKRLGDAVGLTQFGVSLVRLKPGAAAGVRHWHESEDEFVYVLEGEATLVEDEGETQLRAGDAAGFKAGVANGHSMVNKSQADVVMLVVGTRAKSERGHYPDVDLAYEFDGKTFRFLHKSGEPYGS
jgi:uncharacterized cupin superfamily protein